jgi:hypothetical protein
MPLTVEMTPELESQVREQAKQRGIDADEYVVNVLQEHLRGVQNLLPPHLPESEAQLIEQINEGSPPELWQRYSELIAKRRAEILTMDEQTELIVLSDQIEEFNARRLGFLADLARLRHTSLTALMQQLGITTPQYVGEHPPQTVTGAVSR